MTDNDPDIRASDADRAAVTERLDTAFAEGRLDVAEYEQRTGLAMSAKTMGELAQLTRDLPVPVERIRAEQAVERRRRERREYARHWRNWLGGAVVLNVIWVLTCVLDGTVQDYFPVFPLGIWAAVLLVTGFTGSVGRGKPKDNPDGPADALH
ncbi:DUF1707 SHOCT-like domain-containing protein [Goodfellowiella coeruleoviolacea]|uniref:DUF1707 domain-containing protein n=1 Tax=Goodfellowiella coeruleoviolacea TaxID=334858 RepID=A0AAE3GCD6_9PSEU|nr:DUF1707 domain-containing protein [Goodfellowiella coeruleoviolacea]MCP2164814.1 protein of unknown function (DUF1707) [Goodfellowiella coeruleoviolacea]